MLHYDSLMNPTASQQGIQAGKKAGQPSQKAAINQANHMAYLEVHPYKEYEEEDIQQVNDIYVITLTRKT